MSPKTHSCVLIGAGQVSLAGIAPAQDKVYRCGVDGREYSNSPCPGGKVVEVADPRSESQRRDALTAAQRQAHLGEQLARDRRQREAAAANQKAAGIGRHSGKSEIAEKSRTKKQKPKAPKKRSAVDDPKLSPPFKPQGGAPSQ